MMDAVPSDALVRCFGCDAEMAAGDVHHVIDAAPYCDACVRRVVVERMTEKLERRRARGLSPYGMAPSLKTRRVRRG